MKTLFALAVTVAVLGCTPQPTPVPCTEVKAAGDACPDATPAPDAAPPPPAPDAAPAPTPAPDASPPAPPPTPDPTGCLAACANLAKLGCPEGLAGNCGVACSAAQGTVTDLKPACLSKAASVADVQACGTVKCGGASKKKP